MKKEIPVWVTRSGLRAEGTLVVEEETFGGMIRTTHNERPWLIAISEYKVIQICILELKTLLSLHDDDGPFNTWIETRDVTT